MTTANIVLQLVTIGLLVFILLKISDIEKNDTDKTPKTTIESVQSYFKPIPRATPIDEKKEISSIEPVRDDTREDNKSYVSMDEDVSEEGYESKDEKDN